MMRAAFAIPGDIAAPTGGYRYGRELLARMGGHGVGLRHIALPGSFPHPCGHDLRLTAEALASLAAGEVLLVDGLAYGALPEDLCACLRNRVVALVHHPLALENGIAPAVAAALRTSETRALRHAAAVVATSRHTARILMDGYGVPAGRIAVAEPGTEPAPPATGSGGPGTAILAVGAVSVRKGYDLLMDALGPLRDQPWSLVVAGACDRDPAAHEAVRSAVARNGLGEHVTFAGAVSDAALARLYGLADLFVMPSLYEGYGMALAEAMVRGLPIVATTGGAAAETVPDGAALKVPPGDAAALRAALAGALGDAHLRRRLSQASRAAGQALPRWEDTARIVASAIRGVAGRVPFSDARQGAAPP